MKPICIAVALFVMITNVGCVIVRTKAPTIIVVEPTALTGRNYKLGFKSSVWKENRGKIEIICNGWHPREHETYAFILNEPFPVSQGRWLRISPTLNGDGYDIKLWLWTDPNLSNPSIVQRSTEFAGKIETLPIIRNNRAVVRFENIKLSNQNGNSEIIVSGKISSEQVDSEEFRRHEVKAQSRTRRRRQP